MTVFNVHGKVPPVAPAVANAIAAATGKRLTRMPFNSAELVA